MIWPALLAWLIVAIGWSNYMPVPPARSWRADAEIFICLPLVLTIVLLFCVITIHGYFSK